MQYRLAMLNDVNLLTAMRLDFIGIDEKCEQYSLIEDSCTSYFKKALSENNCDVILAEKNGICVGTGIVFYYDSVPSVTNPTGKNAYITSMYVQKNHRRKGIGTEILTRLLARAKERGYSILMLNASDMGKPMYRKMGFKEIENGMILNLERRT